MTAWLASCDHCGAGGVFSSADGARSWGIEHEAGLEYCSVGYLLLPAGGR